MKTIVYVSGPYSADSNELIECNVRTAMDAAYNLMEAGFIVICPHLSYYYGRGDWDFWMDQCLGLLTIVDVMCVIGTSPGVIKEIEQAINLGVAIEYSIASVINNFSNEAIEARNAEVNKLVSNLLLSEEKL